MTRALVADGDPQARASTVQGLRLAGLAAVGASDGQEALTRHAERAVDLIVLDQRLRAPNGLEVCRRLRTAGDPTLILMIAAGATVQDRVLGLEAGADDHLSKPYALDELLARCRALLRRGRASPGPIEQLADLEVDAAGRQAFRAGDLLELTQREFDLLELLVRNRGVVLTRDQIMAEVWGYDASLASNSLDVYVGYLRRKLEAGGRSRLVHTVRGIGFVARVR